MADENLVHGRGDRHDFVPGTAVEGWKAVEVGSLLISRTNHLRARRIGRARRAGTDGR